jgi:hypothetical protein
MKKLEFWLGIFFVILLIFSIMLMLYLDIFWPTRNTKLFEISAVIASFIAATYFFTAPLRRKRKKAQEISALNDPLWDLKKEILKVFTNGPMDFGRLCVTINNACEEEVVVALKEMEAKGVVQKRKPIEDGPDFQMWGITLPDFSKLWLKLRKFFSKRRKG